MTPSSCRVLVALPEPGYFRLFGSTIVSLAQAGWDVTLAFDKPDKRGAARAVPDGAGSNVRSIGAIPESASPRVAALRGVVDYLRYLEAPFQKATYLRRRAEKALPAFARFLTAVQSVPRWSVSLAIRTLRAVDGLVPADNGLVAWLRTAAPDVLFLSPLVTLGSGGYRQAELMKAARAAGVPVVVGAASWDHLTSKGIIRLLPDALLVWNDAQAREAAELHRVPKSLIVVTGAPSLDHWFVPAPDAVAAFRARLGIGDGRAVILFVGSSRNMAPGQTEVEFVRRWASALRASNVPALRDAFILVRPHPTNTDPWVGAAFGPGMVVHPDTYSGMPLSNDEVETFRQSLLVSTAVVGVNTTAMIEAAILERPVFTVRDSAFDHSQAETLHFEHLVSAAGGCAAVGRDLAEHVVQLERTLADPRAAVEAARRFVARFVRPLGVDEPATGHVCVAIERVAITTGRHRRNERPSASGEALAGQGQLR